MRALRRSLVGTVILILLEGLSGAVAQEEEPASAVWVTGTGSPGVMVKAGTQTQVGDALQTRGEVFTDRMVMSDPRVSGTGEGTWDQDWYPGYIGISWRTYRLETEGGAWSGTFTAADGTPTVSSGFLVGEGGYEGLTFYWHQDMGNEISVVGIIFPGDPPTP